MHDIPSLTAQASSWYERRVGYRLADLVVQPLPPELWEPSSHHDSVAFTNYGTGWGRSEADKALDDYCARFPPRSIFTTPLIESASRIGAMGTIAHELTHVLQACLGAAQERDEPSMWTREGIAHTIQYTLITELSGGQSVDAHIAHSKIRDMDSYLRNKARRELAISVSMRYIGAQGHSALPGKEVGVLIEPACAQIISAQVGRELRSLK